MGWIGQQACLAGPISGVQTILGILHFLFSAEMQDLSSYPFDGSLIRGDEDKIRSESVDVVFFRIDYVLNTIQKLSRPRTVSTSPRDPTISTSTF